ncbi:SDR family NAD(P)-dependent oxidoreductase [Halopelagius longus]|uniref:Meso-butanediol dehydrogenase / (S,S)-butanediol dehydrogenase / diacetyl reductase n=1 Tax=Halopelagius longus TaxID=1236180 RepID=A0A1H1GV91_9EURY|nr:SDR family oxidoreductase [Halopelagius longus]RDI69541.1 SDR family oxidoreductase [Halopelagius longus]SDR17097.1 meso-butanediol dehydrogenase / (S,S)-butanediol dehydrogenase / diacetyl reductase [Halopelagius longus]
MNRFQGKTAIVTGGAGTNIGGAITRRLADEGACVGILDLDADAGRTIESEVIESGGEAMFYRADLTDAMSTEAAIESVVNTYGEVDILVNNVGLALGTTLEAIDEETLYRDFEINFKSAFLATKISLPFLQESEGNVIFISSVNALLGGFSEVTYSSAKAGLHSLCRGLTADYGPDGVRFNVIAAGSVIGDSEVWRERERNDPGLIERIEELYPLQRHGLPEDIADATAFLASEEAAWISGVVLPVDGGISATGGLSGRDWWNGL